jgi:hypothetical protein
VRARETDDGRDASRVLRLYLAIFLSGRATLTGAHRPRGLEGESVAGPLSGMPSRVLATTAAAGGRRQIRRGGGVEADKPRPLKRRGRRRRRALRPGAESLAPHRLAAAAATPPPTPSRYAHTYECTRPCGSARARADSSPTVFTAVGRSSWCTRRAVNGPRPPRARRRRGAATPGPRKPRLPGAWISRLRLRPTRCEGSRASTGQYWY